jgi:hypothetical protein
MMAKRKGEKRRRCTADCPENRPTQRATRDSRSPLIIPLAIPAYWTPEEALAVFELVDDLRERIWSIYQTDLQKLMRQQRQSGAIDPLHIDEGELPF